MADPGRNRLGKGLSALLGDLPVEPAVQTPEGGVRDVPVERCAPNPHQPRARFDDEANRALAASVRERGVLQPILVTPDPAGGYRIVAGERRWRAAREAGLETIPAVVRRVEERELVELALIENLQREDLNAIEEARGYHELAERFGLSQVEIARKISKDRSTVANALRLLDLPRAVQELVESGRLSMGHARAVLGVEAAEEQMRLAREAVKGGWSVRRIEAHIRRVRSGARPRRAERNAPSPQARFFEEEIQRVLGARVRIVEGRGGAGRIEVAYNSGEEFELLYAKLLARREPGALGGGGR